MNKAILSIIALLVLFVAGGILLQSAYTTEEPKEEVSGVSTELSLPTQAGTATNPPSTPKATESAKIDTMTNIAELEIEDVVIGTGGEAKEGSTITVNYEGTLLDGTVFDSSYTRGEPFTFELGTGEVIEGWDKGFAGMKVGGKRKLTIPASMAYGNRAIGKIPANSPLVFEVELLEVE